MSQELTIINPETKLIDKLQEMEQKLAPAVFEQMKNKITQCHSKEKTLSPAFIKKRKVLLTDFVNKATSLPLETQNGLSEEAKRQLTRLHLFCCQQAIYSHEVRRNPLILGFHALNEMKTALIGIMLSYRLITPSCPYTWNKDFFQLHILTAKSPDGHTIVTFHSPLALKDVNQALSEELVTDWLIYREHEHNGIRTLMDIKNNLITIPDYQRGGHPEDEFSRFERKMAEYRNKKEARKNDALELEFRKTLVKSVADLTAEKLLSSGMSPLEILNEAFNGNLNNLAGLAAPRAESADSPPPALPEALPEPKRSPAKTIKKQDTSKIESVISSFLDDND